MDFVRYIINCFKVYYPKFLCKLPSVQRFSLVHLQNCCESTASLKRLIKAVSLLFVSAKMIIVDMPWIMNGEPLQLFCVFFQ